MNHKAMNRKAHKDHKEVFVSFVSFVVLQDSE